TEALHDLAAEAADARDVIRLGGAGSADARGGAGALLFQSAAGAEAREGEREAFQRYAPCRDRAAIDTASISVKSNAGEAFQRGAYLTLHQMICRRIAAMIYARRAGDAEEARMLARAVVVQRRGRATRTGQRLRRRLME